MAEHLPGSVEAELGLGNCLASASFVGLLEQIRRDIDSQTLELKRCIMEELPTRTFAAPGANAVLRNAGVAPPEHVEVEPPVSIDDEDWPSIVSVRKDIVRTDDVTRSESAGSHPVSRRARNDFEGEANSLAQKAWSHLSKPTKQRKRSGKMQLRQKSSVEVSFFQRVTNQWWYELVSALLIVLNALTIALETHHRCRRAMEFTHGTVLRDEMHWVVLRDVFCWLFFMELSFRIAAQKLDFFTSSEWEWNVFDCVVVLSAFVETFVSHAQGNQSSAESPRQGFEQIVAHSSLLRILRLLRVVRVLRAVSVSRTMGKLLCFQDLRTMVCALCGALKSLLWVVVTMLLIVLIFAIYFTEGAIDQFILAQHSDPQIDTATLRAKYGGLPTAMLSLLKAITGGEDWGDTLAPLEVLPVLYPFVFMIYVLFGTLALMNIVTAIFVESTISRSRHDQDYVIQAESFAKQEFIQTMNFIFEELDVDVSGQICLDELKKFVESPTIATYFSALDLNITEVRALFSLIDVDNSGTIDRDEFIWGCLRLKGDAKSLDLALLQYDVKTMQQCLEEIFQVIAPEDLQQTDRRRNGHDAETPAARDPIMTAW